MHSNARPGATASRRSVRPERTFDGHIVGCRRRPGRTQCFYGNYRGHRQRCDRCRTRVRRPRPGRRTGRKRVHSARGPPRNSTPTLLDVDVAEPRVRHDLHRRPVRVGVRDDVLAGDARARPRDGSRGCRALRSVRARSPARRSADGARTPRLRVLGQRPSVGVHVDHVRRRLVRHQQRQRRVRTQHADRSGAPALTARDRRRPDRVRVLRAQPGPGVRALRVPRAGRDLRDHRSGNTREVEPGRARGRGWCRRNGRVPPHRRNGVRLRGRVDAVRRRLHPVSAGHRVEGPHRAVRLGRAVRLVCHTVGRRRRLRDDRRTVLRQPDRRVHRESALGTGEPDAAPLHSGRSPPMLSTCIPGRWPS